MADLVKLKTGKIDKLASVDQDNKPVVPLEAGNVYFAVDTTTHKGKIVYDAPNGTSVDRIVMSTDAERADSADKALTADKAVTLVAARNIDGINFNGGANVIHYTTCATNASKVEKIVTINGFALISGARISVRFANTNSADSPTLNVSGTGAKPILYNGTNIPTAYLTNNKVWDFIYDGDLDAWVFVGDKNIDTNTTYTEATATKSGLMSASDKTKLDTIQSGAKVVNYESHLASGVKVGTITIGGTATDIFSTPDTWTAFKGATADAAGSAGYIGNAPAAGEQNAFFTGAGTWKTLTVADDKNNGLMSSDDRTKLDSIESKANYTYLNASAPISVNKHVGTITISHNASGATAGTYGTNSSTALTPGFGESVSVTGFQINATGHVTSASNHNVKMPDTLVDDTHRGLMSSDMYLAWNKGITLAGHQLLLGSAWSKTDFLDTLGLTNALRWIGNATVAIADGSKTDPKVTGYDFSKAKPGDVVLDKDNKREYAWTLAGAWESLGPDGDLATADHRHANATSTTDGFMSADDKAKLDTVESKANYIYVSANAPISVNKHVGALTITHNTSGVTAGAYGDAVAQAPGFGASFLVPNLTVNATGHVTVAGAHTVTIPNALVTDKTNGLMSADDKARFDIIKDSYYVKRAGDTMTGDLCFSNVGTGVRQIQFLAGDNDYGRLAVSATGVNAGWMELATADDGTEPIYVRQYTGPFATVKRTLTLLDASGNTILPGTLTAAGATINGATTINSTLHTTGATTLDSTLSVGGTATMKGALNVNGAATIGSNLTVAGTSTLNGPLVTNGAVTFNNEAFNYAGIGAGTADAFRNVWFSEATRRGQPVYNDNFVYNPGTAQLWIKSDADASSTTKTGALIIGADNGNQIAIDDNEIIARNKSTAGTLYLQNEGGGIETQAIIYNGNGTDASSTSTGSIHTVGGVGIGKQLRVGGATNLGSSLTVASGTSIGGALSVGGNTTLNGNLYFAATGTTGTSKKITFNGSTDGADIYYNVPTSDQGNLVLNMRDDTNAYIQFAYNGTVHSYISPADGIYHGVAERAGTHWSAVTHAKSWSRICLISPDNLTGCNGFLSVNCTRASVVCNSIFSVISSHTLGDGRISQLNSNNYSAFKIRIVNDGKAFCYIEIYDDAQDAESGSAQIWACSWIPLNHSIISPYTSYNAGDTLPNGYAVGNTISVIPGGSLQSVNVYAESLLKTDGQLQVGGNTNLAGNLTVNKATTIYGTTRLGSTLYMNGHNIELGGVGINLIHATSTDDANGYGGAYNNVVIEPWYGFSIGTSCSGQTYTGKNAFSVNARNGETYVGGSLHVNNHVYVDHGYLVSTNNGNTVQIGSANGSYMHFTNSANIPFWFNHDVHVQGNIYGGASYHQRLPMNDGDWGMTFHWNGQGGQPTWLWGGNNSSDMYVYNPSNFNVATARTAYNLDKVRVDSGNTANYIYHRFAYVQDITWEYHDTDSIFLIRQKCIEGKWGIIKCSMRTYGSNDPNFGLRCTWLARYGFAADSVQFGRWGVSGNVCYADLFVKTGSYARMEVINLSDAAQWTMCSSNEVDDTTPSDRKNSSNCYSSLSDAATQLHGKAYTATGVAYDVGIVNYANSAGSVSWSNIKEKTNATSSTAGLMSASDKANLDSHLANKSNPHGVTAAQVGAASKSHTHTSIESVELTGQDLNNYKSNSVQFLYAAGGNTVKNVPSGVTAFGVYCYRSAAGWFTQELISIEGKKYFRFYNASSWTSWNIIIDSSNVASYKVNNAGYADSSGKVNGHTVNADVPSNAKFTDTTYSDATTSAHGLMTAADKAKLNGIASGATKNASTVKSFTLSASSWSSGSYKISDSLITASSNQEVLPAVGITAAQYNALSKAQIVDGGQAAGSFTLKALGTVPTIDIPIRVIFRGTI